MTMTSTTVTTRELTPDQFAELVTNLYNADDKPTVGDLALTLGVSYMIVYRTLKSAGVTLRSRGPCRTESGFLPGSKSEAVAKLLIANVFTPNGQKPLGTVTIAKRVGCTRELVTQVKAKLKDRGILQVGGGWQKKRIRPRKGRVKRSKLKVKGTLTNE